MHAAWGGAGGAASGWRFLQRVDHPGDAAAMTLAPRRSRPRSTRHSKLGAVKRRLALSANFLTSPVRKIAALWKRSSARSVNLLIFLRE